MKSEIIIIEDTVTDYLTTINEELEPVTEIWGQLLSEEFSEQIAIDHNPPYETGTLRRSGQLRSNWKIISSGEGVGVEIRFSGDERPDRWPAFDNPRRDYALYQELITNFVQLKITDWEVRDVMTKQLSKLLMEFLK